MASDCIIPAAGASSRMGAWKPLLPFDGSTIVEATVARALAAPLAKGIRVILVTGFRGEELAARFRGREGVLLVDNPTWEAGMLGSIQRALPLVRGEFFFCTNADMPRLDPLSFARVAEAASGAKAGIGAQAVFAAHDGQAGHPVLLPSRWIGDILSLGPDARMKDFLMSRAHSLVECGPSCLADLDTMEDYEEALATLEGHGPGGLGRPPCP